MKVLNAKKKQIEWNKNENPVRMMQRFFLIRHESLIMNKITSSFSKNNQNW